MLVARAKGWFHWVFVRYNRRLLRSWFAALRIRGLEHLPAAGRADHSFLVLGNHTSWWDGLVQGDVFERTLGLDYYVMIEEAQVRAHPFFRKVGGFSINSQSPGDVRQSLRYVSTLLGRSGRVVSVFPQGRVVSAEQVIACQRGVCVLLGRGRLPAHTQVAWMSIHYGFWRNSRPEVFVQISPPTDAGLLTTVTADGLAERMNAEVARLRTAVARMQPGDWQTLWTGRFDFFDGVQRQAIEDV